MSNHFWPGMGIILLSGALNAAFALPMKLSRTWKWENLWLVFSVVGILAIPWGLAFALTPGLMGVYSGVTARALYLPILFGFLWGIAQVTFGVSLRIVGVALTFAIVSGLASLSGSLIPMLTFHPAEIFQPRGVMLLLSIPFLMVGLTLYAIAGRRREREQAGATSGPPPQSVLTIGLILCIFTGIFGSFYNLGFAFGGEVVRASHHRGAGPITSTYAIWALVLGAGFVPNLAYCLYLLKKNRTTKLFKQSGSSRETALGVVMAIAWVTAVLSYGVGATVIGADGTSIGYMLFTSGSILFANAFGLMAGEWKCATPRTKMFLAGAIVLILASVIILNLGGLFHPSNA